MRFLITFLTDVNFENVDVVHINSPSSFYVQLVRSKQQLQNMSDELSVHIKNLAGYVHEPAIGKFLVSVLIGRYISMFL